MKRSKKDELRTKDIGGLQTVLAKTEDQMVKLTMEKVSGKTKDKTVVRQKRQKIAVIKTLIREKQLAMEVSQ